MEAPRATTPEKGTFHRSAVAPVVVVRESSRCYCELYVPWTSRLLLSTLTYLGRMLARFQRAERELDVRRGSDMRVSDEQASSESAECAHLGERLEVCLHFERAIDDCDPR